MTITQNFFVKNDGLSITPDVGDLTNHTEIGSVYSVCVFEYKGSLFDESPIEVRLQDYFFNGFVYKQTFKDNSMTTIECRSLTAMLTTPYDTGAEEIMPQRTAHEVIQELCDRVGVTVNISTVDFDIGTNFKKEGTALQSIMKLAEVTGAEVFDASGVLVIRPRKFIDITGLPIMETEVIDKVDIQEIIANDAVGVLYLGRQTSSSSTRNNAFIHANIDNSTGVYDLFYSPSNFLTSVNNSTSRITRKLIQTASVEGIEEFFTDTAISSLVSIKINGVSVGGGFDHDTNKINFHSLQTGYLEIEYFGFVNTGTVETRNGYYLLTTVTGDGEEHSWSGKLTTNSNSDNNHGMVNGVEIYIRVPRQLNYVKGFTLFAAPSVTEKPIFLEDGDITLMETVTLTAGTSTINENLSTDSGTILTTTSKIDSIVAVKYKGYSISYSLQGDDQIVLDEPVNKPVSVTYITAGTDIYVEGTNRAGADVYMLFAGNKYSLEGYDPDDYRTYPSGLPQTTRLDVARMFGGGIDEVRGKTILIEKPDGTMLTATVDDTGFVEFIATDNGEYKLDMSAIRNNAKAVFTVEDC